MTSTLRVRRRGPLQLEGPARLVQLDGTTRELAAGERVLLCRCGASGTKPFCDGAHNRVAFAPEEAAPPPPRTDD